MTPKSHRLGRAGERVAARYLKRRGLRVIDRNWRCRGIGEVDLLARDSDTLIVVEVRTRSKRTDGRYGPESSVTPAKIARLTRLADAWVRQQRWRPASVRVDLVACEHRGLLRWDVRWHQGIA